jgi:uncharacterized protein YodC (DUF2158 family)
MSDEDTVLKVGDVVSLKSGGHLMTVAAIDEGSITCGWSLKGDTKSKSFPAAALKEAVEPLTLEQMLHNIVQLRKETRTQKPDYEAMQRDIGALADGDGQAMLDLVSRHPAATVEDWWSTFCAMPSEYFIDRHPGESDEAGPPTAAQGAEGGDQCRDTLPVSTA